MGKKKIQTIVQLLIAAGASGGVFLVFEWKTALAMLSLAGVVAAQTYLLTTRIKPKKKSLKVGGTPFGAQTLNGEILSKEKLKVSSTSSEPPKTKEETAVDSSVFSAFKQNLDKSEKRMQDLEPPAKKAVKEADTEEVVVSLSSHSKKNIKTSVPKAKPVPKQKTETPVTQNIANPYLKKGGAPTHTSVEKSKPPTTPVKVESPVAPEDKLDQSIGNLFDDIHEPLIEPEKTEERPRAVTPKKRKKPKEPAIKKETPTDPIPVSEPANEPLTSHEVLTSEDLIPDQQQIEKEEAVFLSLAKQTFEENEHKKCLNLIERWIKSREREGEVKLPKDLLPIKAECEFELEEFDKAARSFGEMLEKKIRSRDADLMGWIDDLIERFSAKKQQPLAIPFYFTALSEYKKDNDYNKMDKIYAEIERAYRTKKDWDRLISTYQNHLSIKKNLNDAEGQLTILDSLGKILYDRGDSDGSKRCYQQSIEIKKELAGQT